MPATIRFSLHPLASVRRDAARDKKPETSVEVTDEREYVQFLTRQLNERVPSRSNVVSSSLPAPNATPALRPPKLPVDEVRPSNPPQARPSFPASSIFAAYPKGSQLELRELYEQYFGTKRYQR